MPKNTPVVAWSTSVDNSMSADKAQIMNEEEQRLEAHAERSSSFLFLLTEWAENTSWGGVPFIVKKSNYIFKAMWMALVIAGLTITAYQTWQVFDRFFKYPVNINVNITYSTKLTFPAVTICNVNVMKASGFSILSPETFVLLGTFFGNQSVQSVTNAERLRTAELFEQVYNSMDYNIRIAASHRKTDMILDCVYNGGACTTDDFLEWNDPTHGNCFTFNLDFELRNNTFIPVAPRDSYRTGPNYVACQQNISQLFAEDLLNCDHCSLACSNIVYSHSVSSARWPNERFMKTKLDHVASINSNFANYRVNATSPQNNILKFNIHFEELNYELIYESPAYSSDSIYGDIGGVIGLWLGMSFIAIFELIQLMMDSLVLCITMLTTRKKQRRGNKM